MLKRLVGARYCDRLDDVYASSEWDCKHVTVKPHVGNDNRLYTLDASTEHNAITRHIVLQ